MEGIDEKLNNKIVEDFEGQQFEMSEKKKESRKLLASEIAGSIVKELKPLLEKDTSEKIVEAIKNNKPIVNVEPPIVKVEEKRHEIKLPKIEVPKTVVNLKPNIEVKASEVKIPSVMEVKGFKDFAKLAITILKNKFKIDATKEEPLPVQLVHDNKFYEAIGGVGGPRSVWLKNEDGKRISVQQPLSVDGDSIYEKDIDVDNSSKGTFTGTIVDLFNDLVTTITDTTATDPKHFTVKLKRPMKTGQVNISTQTGNYSNVKIIFYDESGEVRYTHDDSSNNTKYTKNSYNFPPIAISGFKIEFHTADTVNVGFIFIQKSIAVISRMQGIDADGLREDVGTVHNHFKNIGFHESIGHGSTNDDTVIERAMGRKTGIGAGAYTLLEEAAFVQPAGDTQMYVESASVNDASAGTGIQQITIEYFAAAWGDLKTTVVTMNGTTQVTIGVSDIYRIHKAYATRVGSNGVAAGLIKLTNQAEDVLYGQIAQYHAFMQRCIFYVGNGKQVTCTEAILGTYSKEGIIARVFASEEDSSGNLVPRARCVCEIAGGILACPFSISETVANPNNKRIAIGLAVAGVAAAQTATGTLKGFSETS